MNLRPHHLLCIQKFTGHGYDENFTAHMTSVVSELADRPETQIVMTKGCDELCTSCPHNRQGVCTSYEKVDLMDGKVLGICGLTYGEAVPWDRAAGQVRKLIFQTDGFQQVCGQCQWLELCRKTEVSYE